AEWYACCRECHGFLAAAPKHKRIAALQAQYPLAALGQCNETLRDVRLSRRRSTAAFAGKLEPRLRSLERQHALIDQRVVHNDIRLDQPRIGMQREQTRIARPGAGKPHVPGLQDRCAFALVCECVPAAHTAAALMFWE